MYAPLIKLTIEPRIVNRVGACCTIYLKFAFNLEELYGFILLFNKKRHIKIKDQTAKQ